MVNEQLILHTETFFDSSHELVGYDGKCSFIHGHTWRVRVWFKGHKDSVNNIGILVDFGIVNEVKNVLDHKKINDILDKNPTAENMVQWIYIFLKERILPNIGIRVRLYETAVGKETYCEYGDF